MWIATIAAGSIIGGAALQQQRLNPVIELLAAKKPAFGLYAPANPRVGGGRGRGAAGAAQAGTAGTGAAGSGTAAAPTPPPPPQKTPGELAKDAFGYKNADYIFDGSMEGATRFDQAYATFSEFSKGLTDAGYATSRRLSHPLYVKTPEIAADPKLAAEHIAKQLNAGAVGIVFVGVESADEVKQGLAMMRFKSNGGMRPDDVGNAPALLGLTEKEYREKADVWPLNPKGELVNFTIVESKEGLAHVREIAAVKGIGVLFPGAGTLGGVFTTTDSTGRRVRDEVAWENSIQQVLAACKEFNVPCGYPANDSTMMERRIKEGFSVFITGWGETGFKAVEVGKKVGGR